MLLRDSMLAPRTQSAAGLQSTGNILLPFCAGEDATSLLLNGSKGPEEGRLISEELRILAAQVAAEAEQESAAAAVRMVNSRA